MKRLHIHIAVKDIQESKKFYTTLFGVEPTKEKEDYEIGRASCRERV